MNTLAALSANGQSPWLNYLRRAFIETGELRDEIREGIRGITSTPAIFERAITSSSDYDEPIMQLTAEGRPVKEIYELLVCDDVQRAADVLQPVFESSGGLDGYVTVELNPNLVHDPVKTVAEARHVLHRVNRANAMVEIPATEAGIEAIYRLTADGVNVNATHIFSLSTYQKVAKAYLDGITEYVESHSVWRQFPSSAASFSLNRLDNWADRVLLDLGHPELRGRTAIAIAKSAYRQFMATFGGSDWDKIAHKGARFQRLKWTRTTPSDFAYPDTRYVDELIGPGTITTLSRATLNAFRDHGAVSPSLTDKIDESVEHLNSLADMGVDLEAIGHALQQRSLANFEMTFQALIESVSRKRNDLESNWKRVIFTAPKLESAFDLAMNELAENQILHRIWKHDHTVWPETHGSSDNKLGWLHIADVMRENVARLQDFTARLEEEGFDRAVLLGMGGASLASAVFTKVFMPWRTLTSPDQSGLVLDIIDTTDPATIHKTGTSLDLKKTLFVVSSKSGATIETMANLRYFYNLAGEQLGYERAGDHFIAITDPGSELVNTAREHHFRHIFLDDPTIGGRFSALSFIGLVPAALVGVDLVKLLDRAQSIAANAHSCNYPIKGDNLAAQLGSLLAVMSDSGRDKMTLFSSAAVKPFEAWIEHLIAGSTGKNGKGILPVTGEPLGSPSVYNQDRFFVYLSLAGDQAYDQGLDALSQAGFPVITIRLKDIYDLGALFFMWEMAAAIACYFFDLSPFEQPSLDAIKEYTDQVVDTYLSTGTLPNVVASPVSRSILDEFIEERESESYIALHPFLEQTEENDKALTALRVQLRDRYKLATTLEYGPQYLHITGQLHQGGKGNGLFVQFTTDHDQDLLIPDQLGEPGGRLTFATLRLAQALGEGSALIAAGRKLVRFHLHPDKRSDWATLINGDPTGLQ